MTSLLLPMHIQFAFNPDLEHARKRRAGWCMLTHTDRSQSRVWPTSLGNCELDCANINTGLCFCNAPKKNKITPQSKFLHAQRHTCTNIHKYGILKAFQFSDEWSKIIEGLAKNMRKRGKRNVLIGCCLWWWMGAVLLVCWGYSGICSGQC